MKRFKFIGYILVLAVSLLLIEPAVHAAQAVQAAQVTQPNQTGKTAGSAITVLVNGKKVAFPDQQPFIDANKRTLVPVRFVSTALNAVVDWEAASNTVTIVQGDNTVKLRIGENKALINDRYRTFDTKAILKNGRTMVPLRFVSEILGAKVEWLAKTNTVRITVNNGYTLPKETDLLIEVRTEKDNPHNVDIGILILMDKNLETQYQDAYNILASKFGHNIAQKVLKYIRQKKNRDNTLEEKKWSAVKHIISVGSNAGSLDISITVYKSNTK